MGFLWEKRVVAASVAVGLLAVGLVLFVIFRKTSEVPPAPVTEPVANVAAPKHTVIGSSVQGRKIDAYSYGQGQTNILFVGGIHGGYEWNSVLLAYTFMDYLAAHPEVVPANLTVTVVPSANPDGVFKVIGKEGRFAATDVPAKDSSPGRFNANGVDLNRNFDCKWQAEAVWRGNKVGAGTAAFSEPEARAIRDYVLAAKPAAGIFWHSQANAVYASKCDGGILPVTLHLMNSYAKASGYPAVQTFDAYPVTGDVEGWMAKIGIPAITVELKTHESIEWEKNLAGIKAVIGYYGVK